MWSTAYEPHERRTESHRICSILYIITTDNPIRMRMRRSFSELCYIMTNLHFSVSIFCCSCCSERSPSRRCGANGISSQTVGHFEAAYSEVKIEQTIQESEMLSVSMKDEEVTISHSSTTCTADICRERSDTVAGYTVDQAMEKLEFGPFQLVTFLICSMVCNNRRTDNPQCPLSISQVSMVTLQ